YTSFNPQRVAPYHLLPSFPTRRSSDLAHHGEDVLERSLPLRHELCRSHPPRRVRSGLAGDEEHATPCGSEDPVSPSARPAERFRDRKSTRLNSSHVAISYAVVCLKKKH